MAGKNKFGFEPLEPTPAKRARERTPGPMGVAVRDAAENMTVATEAKVEQRRRNAEDAKAYRAAQADGRLLQRLPVGNLATDDLPRDRLELEAVARSDEMEELKASIRARGQKEPIEVYRDATGTFQLKKGWRRLTALRQLLEETGDDQYAEVISRVETGPEDRLAEAFREGPRSPRAHRLVVEHDDRDDAALCVVGEQLAGLQEILSA